MQNRHFWPLAALLVVLLAGTALVCVGVLSERGEHPAQTAMPPMPAATAKPVGEVTTFPQPEGERPPIQAAEPPVDPYAILSQEAMLATIDALASIQPYSGWRNSATTGEAEALDHIDQALDSFGHLAGLGLEKERQSFEVPLSTEQWETALRLVLDGSRIEVPVSGLRGSRSDPALAANVDSDGILGDSERNPISVEGPVVIIRTVGEVDALVHGALEGSVVLLDYAVIDPIVRGGMEQAASTAAALLAHQPAGLVLVTEFSNDQGESHGVFAQEGGSLNRQAAGALPPTVVARLEDLSATGIEGWNALRRVENAELRWDADVLAPAMSGNLVVRVPGRDLSRAVILGAHVDSANNPGAMDDASGSAILLEIARVLDATQTQPPTDLYLVWFGSEELGLLGSAHFVSTHPDLLGRTMAMLQVDCLTYPLEGIDAQITLVTWSESGLGAERLSWPAYLSTASGQRGVTVAMEDVPEVYSDNYPFESFSIPNADLIYLEDQTRTPGGSLHNAAHIHDPYDSVELARQMADILEGMARVALTAALDPLP